MVARRVLLAASALPVFVVGLLGASVAAAKPVSCAHLMEGTIHGNLLARSGCELANAVVDGNVKVTTGGSFVTRAETSVTITGGVISDKASDVRMDASGSIGSNVWLKRTSGEAQVTNSTVEGQVRIEKNLGSVGVGGTARSVMVHNNTVRDANVDGIGSISVAATISGALGVNNNSLSVAGGNALTIAGSAVDGAATVDSNSLAGGERDVAHIADNSVGGSLRVNDDTVDGSTESLTFIGDNTITENLACSGDSPAPTDIGSGPEPGPEPNSAAQLLGQCAGL
jgi:hypothetical protein